MVRYGEESQQIAPDKLAGLINVTRGQIEKAAEIQSEDDLRLYVSNVRSVNLICYNSVNVYFPVHEFSMIVLVKV